MRRSELTGSILLALILAWPWSLSGAESQTEIAQLDVAPTRIDWLPQVDAERLVLTVSGPGDLFIRREFESGKAPVLAISDPEWENLPDGSYTWELRAIPHPTSQLPQRPLVSSGHFSVKDGSFVALRTKAPVGPPRPPRLLTAETYFDTDISVEGNACIGTSCTIDDPDPNFPSLILKSPQPNIRFDDQFVEGGSSPHDWAVFINSFGAAEFSIADLENSLIPFTIAGGAPNSSLYVAGNGNLGLGTATPTVKLHVLSSGSGPTDGKVLVQNTSGTSAARELLEVRNANGAAQIVLEDVAQTPRWVMTGSNAWSINNTANVGVELQVNPDGIVGIGTGSPDSKLHVFNSSGGDAHLHIEETNGTTANRTMLEIENNGGSRINLLDTSTGGTWGLNNIGDTFRILRSGTGVTAFTLQSNGNLTIAGTLTQGSSRDIKTNLAPLEPKDVLSRVTALPISLWSYKTDGAVRHVGPMAEDFHLAFGLGVDDKHLAPGDQAGIALLAVQGLSQVVQEKDAAIAQLEQTVDSLRQQNSALAARLAAIEQLLKSKP